MKQEDLSGKFTHIDDDDSERLEQLRGMFEQGFLIVKLLMNGRILPDN